MGNVTNNSTRVRIGYRIYSHWRFTAAQITNTENITQALVASWILLSELHCTESLTRTELLRMPADVDWLRRPADVDCVLSSLLWHCQQQWKHWPSYCWLLCNATILEWWAYPWNYCGYGYLVTTASSQTHHNTLGRGGCYGTAYSESRLETLQRAESAHMVRVYVPAYKLN
jgi:hypothetical protein